MTPDELRSLVQEATPGPWFYDSYAGIRSSSEDNELDDYVPVARVNTGLDGSHWRDDGRHNAHLISLAPQLALLVAEMGEALEACREYESFAKSADVALASLEALEKPQ